VSSDLQREAVVRWLARFSDQEFSLIAAVSFEVLKRDRTPAGGHDGQAVAPRETITVSDLDTVSELSPPQTARYTPTYERSRPLGSADHQGW